MADTESTAAPAPASSDSTGAAAPSMPQHQRGQAAMAQALVERGAWTQEQANEALAGLESGAEVASQADTSQPAAFNAAEFQGALTAAGLDDVTSRFVGDMFRKASANPPSEEARYAAMAETEQHLRQQWGDKYDAMVDAARKEMHQLAQTMPELPDLVERTGLGNHPWIISSLAGRGVERAKRQFLGLE